MKKGLFLMLPFLVFALGSCKSKAETIIDDSGDRIIKRRLNFIADKNSMFNVSNNSIITYYFDDNIPYVSIDDFIDGVDYYDKKVIVSDDYDYRFVTRGYNKHVKLNYDKNQMIIYDFELFSLDEKIYVENVSYNKNLLMSIDEVDEDAHSIVNLSEYDLRIKKADNKLLLPFHLINTLFSIDSYYSLYYTGDAYYGYSCCDDIPTFNKKATFKLDDNYLNYNYNLLRLIFNEFYALKYYNKEDILDLMEAKKDKFLNDKEYLSATKEFIVNLEDLHTAFSGLSDLFNIDYASYRSERRINASSLLTDLSRYYNEEYGSYFSGFRTLDETTALIPFTSFSMENEKNTALILALYLEQCKSQGIENIIFDVTQNGGGDTFSLAQILGLMTNDDIVLDFYNVRTNHQYNEIFKVDADFDGDFEDEDAYTDFNYYVLSSGYSYSCANNFVNYCKRHNLAKIIGKKSGGGGCCIAPFTTPTGGLILMSGLMGMKDKDGILCEDGIEVDYEIEYENIYKKDYLLGAIDSFKI